MEGLHDRTFVRAEPQPLSTSPGHVGMPAVSLQQGLRHTGQEAVCGRHVTSMLAG
jgi:hypothetical protein